MSDSADTSPFTGRKRHLSQPCLILLMGVGGTGKSTLAREILQRLWAVYLDNNHIVDAFFPHTRNGRASAKLRPRFYQALHTIVEENLKMGNSVLLDVPHVKEMQIPKWRRFIKSLAARTKSKLIVIRCRCSERALRARLESRGEKRDRWKLDHWDEFLTQQPIDIAPAFSYLDIDTDKDVSKNVKSALRYILRKAQGAWRIEQSAGRIDQGAGRRAHRAKGKEQSAKDWRGQWRKNGQNSASWISTFGKMQ
jgi:predicted kinase